MISSQRFPSFGALLVGSRAARGQWFQTWRSLNADVDAMVQRLPTSGAFWLDQYASIVARFDAGDPEITSLGNAEKHVTRMREILAAQP
ncbi:hypothetical protein [Cyanobium gracile]|uniref:hypothetical protein n=1 Tax=Cyanobium gracile TaxID=59930 RepID=UPI0005BDDCBB|nr:hypothetical protein [Cyanobium gracile]